MDAAIAKFEQFTNYDLFAHVGEPLPPDVEAEDHRETAILHCISRKWENCRLQARNALQRKIERKYQEDLKFWERAEEWNPICQKLRPRIKEFTASLQSKPTPLSAEIDRIKNDLEWDILLICLEYEFQDIVAPFFYLPLIDRWYRCGHLPCGWTGPPFPIVWDGSTFKGKLIVY